MKRSFKLASILLTGLFLVIAGIVSAQTPPSPPPTTNPNSIIGELNGMGVDDGAYKADHLGYRKPIPYVHEREADIMWQRRIWRVIDLREKINHPLYYPDDSLAKRPSLFQVIKNGIRAGKITTAFEFDIFTNEFGKPLSQAELLKAMTGEIAMKDSLGEPLFDSTGSPQMMADPIRPEAIAQYYLKEDWFFEKQRSVMDVRILAIAPVIEINDEAQGKFTYKPLFWLYYQGLRDYLSQHYCYNPYNDAEWRTFDEIFHKRLFSSFVRMESNVYNRSIAAYLAGQSMEMLLEAERIKDDIFKIEHDMWNF